jgi:hypothetical protein
MSFPPGTEMFQFPGFAPPRYGFAWRYPIAGVGCPIRRSPDRSLLAAPRGFSQRATSFVASRRQGIHQMPFSRSPRPGGSTTGTARRIPMPGRRTAAPRDGDRRPPVSPASAGPRGSGRPASTTPPHDAKRDRRRRRGAARDRPPGGAGAPKIADRRPPPEGVVGPGRLERPTSRLSGVRSDRLSYGPAPDARRRRGGLGEGTGGRRGRPSTPREAEACAGTLERR